MRQIHFVINRINPALKINLVRIGEIVEGQFKPVDSKVFADETFYPLIQHSDISEAPYILHSKVLNLVSALSARDGFKVDFFDNTMVLIANFNLDTDEVAPKEENKGN